MRFRISPLAFFPLLLAPLAGAAPAPIVETGGLVAFEAEAAHAVIDPTHWATVPAGPGTAMKVLESGPWKRHLRFDLEFTTPGTYRLWLRARKNPAAPRYHGNDVKVFFYATAEEQAIHPKAIRFEVGLREQREFRWLAWPKSREVGATDLTVAAPGLHHLYLAGGAAEEWGWEIDAVRLTKDNREPPPGGTAPYAEAPAADAAGQSVP
jgi:hypothetical protein